MRYRVLACDYDGTIARHGSVSPTTLEALRRAARAGRKLVLVTGRLLEDLQRVFAEIELFDFIVAENGGLLYQPSTRDERALGSEPPKALVALLEASGITPLSAGRVILGTWEPHEKTVLAAIRTLGLEHQVIFNKGAVMVLPAGVNKRTGLEAALERLGFSPHNCVGVGDAENDHAFLSVCECSVAVANALPAVKDGVDWVTDGDHGEGVRELIDALIADDLAALENRLTRHHVLLGTRRDGSELSIAPYGRVVLVAGSSGGGKTTVAAGVIERLAGQHFQTCIVDPEGDYEGIPNAVVAGTPEQAPDIEQVLQMLARWQNHAVVNLLGVPLEDRGAFVLMLIARLAELRAVTSRPHWIVIDEAHHVFGAAAAPAVLTLPQQLGAMLLVTVHPQELQKPLLHRVDVMIAVGENGWDSLGEFALAAGHEPPALDARPEQGQALTFDTRSGQVELVNVAPAERLARRHRRKYARGELGPDKSFYFRGPEGRLKLRAHNLIVFLQIAEGVDDETWSHHLSAGDYSRWIRDAIKDEELALEVGRVEGRRWLAPGESRRAIREAIELKYTMPA